MNFLRGLIKNCQYMWIKSNCIKKNKTI
jgi:hypothetical protein